MRIKLAEGVKRSPEYRTWENIKQRCYNPNYRHYKYYGGKGIEVCERWRDSFQNFLDDMGKRPRGDYSIDRIDGTKGYSPENCRWATRITQQNNKRNNRLLTHDGKTQTMSEWSRELNIPLARIWWRLNKGWTIERALSS